MKCLPIMEPLLEVQFLGPHPEVMKFEIFLSNYVKCVLTWNARKAFFRKGGFWLHEKLKSTFKKHFLKSADSLIKLYLCWFRVIFERNFVQWIENTISIDFTKLLV